MANLPVMTVLGPVCAALWGRPPNCLEFMVSGLWACTSNNLQDVFSSGSSDWCLLGNQGIDPSVVPLISPAVVPMALCPRFVVSSREKTRRLEPKTLNCKPSP